MKTENVSFESEGQKIAGVIHLPERRNAPCAVASHGLLSSKDSEKYIALGERLSQEGVALLRFDFRGIGESEGRIEDDTITRRVEDLGSAVHFVRSTKGLGNRIGLLGSSLGGYVSLIEASTKGGIRTVVIWATPSHLDDFESRKQEDQSPVPREAFFKDLPNHCLLPLLRNISKCLVIHGSADELVPVERAWEIFHHLGEPKELRIIEGGDHRLTQPAHRQQALDLTVSWFKKYL